jgi:hypothetical protein
MELAVFGAEATEAESLVCLPQDGELHRLRLTREGDGFTLEGDPLQSRVAFRVVHCA